MLLFFLGSLMFLDAVLGLASSDLPNTTSSGYLDLRKSDGSQMFYAYYEAEESRTNNTPILLWLQVKY